MSNFTNQTKSSSSFTEETKSGFVGYILAELDNDPAFTMVGEDEDFVLTFDDGISWGTQAKTEGGAWYNIVKSS
jgi:hypothetical protein